METNNSISLASPEDIKKVSRKIADMNFWLYVRFADITTRYLEVTMEKDNLSPLQSLATWFLVFLGGTATPTQLARIMFRSKHSITQVVDNLEKEGLIVREYTNKDRRVTYIKLTDAGLERVKQNFHKGNKRAQEVMVCLDSNEQQTMVDLSEKMRKRMIEILNEL
jgi:MarR family transcriptional regulator, 2-MHQ and catechol-resistance regulon repressor